ELVLRPGKPGLQEKKWPIDSFFHKIVMIRNRLRTLEQQVNSSDLPDDAKVRLQSYISGCYGTLTSFNVLFADEEDQFKGSRGDCSREVSRPRPALRPRPRRRRRPGSLPSATSVRGPRGRSWWTGAWTMPGGGTRPRRAASVTTTEE